LKLKQLLSNGFERAHDGLIALHSCVCLRRTAYVPLSIQD